MKTNSTQKPKAPALRGILSALVTPMTATGEVDHAKLAAFADHLVRCGVHGLIPLGSTGEYYALDPSERERVLKTTLSAVAGRVPVIEEAWALAAEGIIPAGSWSNLDSLETAVVWAPGLRENANIVLADAQTSGGLLIAVGPAKTESLLRELHRLGVAEAVVIGEMVEDPQGRIWVEP